MIIMHDEKKKIWRKNAPNWNNMSKGKGWRGLRWEYHLHMDYANWSYRFMFYVVQGIRICRQKWDEAKKKNKYKKRKERKMENKCQLCLKWNQNVIQRSPTGK